MLVFIRLKSEIDLKCFFFRNIASGLDFLHTKEVVHTAIHPENILVTDALTAKLSRLGDIILISEKLVSSNLLSSKLE